MTKQLGRHRVLHTCGHTVQYIACPPRYDIAIMGETAAYAKASKAHKAYAEQRPCEDCENMNQEPQPVGWH